MNTFEQEKEKSILIDEVKLECPVSPKGRSRFKFWLKRAGVAGFVFFLVKGLIWIAIFIFGAEAIKGLF